MGNISGVLGSAGEIFNEVSNQPSGLSSWVNTSSPESVWYIYRGSKSLLQRWEECVNGRLTDLEKELYEAEFRRAGFIK